MDAGLEIRRDIMQRATAIRNGAYVRPPRDSRVLATDEAATEAEIDRLEARRESLFRQLGEPRLPAPEREALRYSLQACSRSLDTAFADRRRLRVARSLFEQGIFA